MFVNYVPLLARQRELYQVPRGRERFGAYLRSMVDTTISELELVPLAIINPMAREHVADFLDVLITAQADDAAAETVAQTALLLEADAGPFRASVVVADDVGGGWTNRWTHESALRFGGFDLKRPWITGVLWCGDKPSVTTVEQTIRASMFRADEMLRFGPPRTLREMMAREGAIIHRAGNPRPPLDPDEADYTREVIQPFLDEADVRITVECLFGDVAARSLGFTPRGLSPWAGLDLAAADAREAAECLSPV